MRTFVVLGCHRSATSFLAEALADQGVAMGEQDWSDENNPQGYYENLEFQELNDRILIEAGGSWSEPPSREEIKKVDLDSNGEVEALVRKSQREMWGWKDPRTALTLDHYLPYLDDDVYLVAVFRKPERVAKSLNRIHGHDIDDCLRLTKEYNNRIIEQVKEFIKVPHKIPVRKIRVNKPFRLEDYYTDENSEVTGPKGAFCFIERNELCDEAKKLYGRENDKLCLKVFYSRPLKGKSAFSNEDDVTDEDSTVEGHYWCDHRSTTVLAATRIQDICAWEGYAPLVRGFITVEWDDRLCLAQLTEDTGLMYVMEAEDRKTIEEAFDRVKGIAEKWGYSSDKQELNDGNFWGGGTRAFGKTKWLDFQDFVPSEDYERKVVDLVLEQCQHFSVPLYEKIPPLMDYFIEKDVKGWRDCDIRFKDFGLDKYDWGGKTLIDFGCDNGMMMFEAHKAGALRTVGIEPERRFESMRHISNYVGNWNADFYGFDLKGATTENLKELTGFDGFDVVFFLAMGNHVGHFPEYLAGVCKDMLVYEQNKNEVTSEETIVGLKKLGFTSVEHKGATNEADQREFFIARR